jgi:polyferredoxin
MRASASSSDRPARRLEAIRPSVARPLVQAAVLSALVAVPAVIFHTLCPLGGVETLVRVALQGRYVPKTGAMNLILLGAALLSALVAGPVFCGWICPLGAVQDWTRKAAARLGIRAARVPERLDRAASLLRFVVLALVLWATAGSFNLVFMRVDPYHALLRFWTGEVAPAALIVLGLVLAASAFVARPWCRWLCPLGGILSTIGRASLVKMRRPAAACPSCGACSRACPVGIDPSREPIISDPRCIRCGDCAAACPASGSQAAAP